MKPLAVAFVGFLAFSQFGCAPPPMVPKKAPLRLGEPEIDQERGVDVGVARKLLERAEQALKNGELPTVKRLCEQARPFGDDDVRETIRNLLQRTDERLAKDLAPAVLELAKSGECQKAAELSVAIAEEQRGTTVVRFLRLEVSKPVLSCLLDALAVDVSIARELAETSAIKKVLTSVDFEQWDSKLDEAIVGSLVAGLQAPMAARNWLKVETLLDEMVGRKEAGPREVERVLKLIRAGVTEDVEKKATTGLGVKTGAAKLLKDIDSLIEAGRWTEADPVPEPLEQRHREAAAWAICAAQDCALIAPQLNWSFGVLEPRPVLDVAGPVSEKVPHAHKVWKLTSGRGLVLVADHDPGELEGIAARIPVGLGWVPAQNLSPADTAERLPPGAGIVGTWVWGGFRGPLKEWELGQVKGAKGDELSIERASDGKVVSARRGEVHFGTLRVGTKVLAFCQQPAKLEAAMIDEVIRTSSFEPTLKVSCIDDKGARIGEPHLVLRGSLRTQSGWTPVGD